MRKDYLWDGSGEPDPEVRRLEDLLGRYGHTPAEGARRIAPGEEESTGSDKDTGTGEGSREGTDVDEVNALRPADVARGDEDIHETVRENADRPERPSGSRLTQAHEAASDRARFGVSRRTTSSTAAASRRRRRLAAIVALPFAAVFLFAMVAVWRASRQTSSGWEVVRTAGAPAIGAAPIADTERMPVGGWIETDAVSRATIKVGMIGEAELEPHTRVQLVSASLTEHRLALARGTLHARIWAPPRLFYVETPSALAVDLGCAYTITVDEAGASFLKVESGWVAFEHEGRESFVPAGALCVTRPGTGPGTPYYEDASPRFRAALAHLDFGPRAGGGKNTWPNGPLSTDVLTATKPQENGPASLDADTQVESGAHEDRADRGESLGVILDEARGRDSLTLWHLLSRLEGEERGRVYDRMAALVPPPAFVTRDAVLRGDSEMIDRWWDQLGLGVTSWWRLWKGPGPSTGQDSNR